MAHFKNNALTLGSLTYLLSTDFLQKSEFQDCREFLSISFLGNLPGSISTNVGSPELVKKISSYNL